MWLYWEQVHDSMQLYIVSITDNICLSLAVNLIYSTSVISFYIDVVLTLATAA